MHSKPDLRVDFVHEDHFFRLGDLGRYPPLVLMFRFGIRTILILVSVVCACAATFVFLIATLRPLSPAYYADYLNTAPEIYAQLDDLSALDFGQRIYIYDESQFVDAISGCESTPSVANENGQVPALKFNGDIFIILRKWVNESGGLAISDDPEFASKLEQFDDDFVVKHLHSNVYHWKLDLERDSYR